MESRYGLEMTSLTIANINRAILKGQEKGVFELPKGPSGKVKLAKAAEDKEVRLILVFSGGNCSTRLTAQLHRMKPPRARLRLASPPCTKRRPRESARLRVLRLVRLPPNLRSPPRRCADSRPAGLSLHCALMSLTSICIYVMLRLPRASSLDRSIHVTNPSHPRRID